MNILLKHATVNRSNNDTHVLDIWIQNDKIHALGSNLSQAYSFDEVIELNEALVTPGLVDIHVHLREPGFTEKETILSGSLSAASGGFTTICAMPNVSPVPDTPEQFQKIQKIIQRDAYVHVYQYAPITQNLHSKQLVDFKELKDAGAFAFTNDGVGVQTAATMYEAMLQAKQVNKPIVAHTEDDSLVYNGVMHQGKKSEVLNLPGILSVAESTQIARDVLLAEATGVHYHICHVSCKESVRVIRDAKAAGIHVTAEVTPHHLLLTDQDIPKDHGHWKMNPPLRAEEDRQALIEGLLDGTIDFIATDHAPHTKQEKNTGFLNAPFGIIGLETAFPLMYTYFVKENIMTLEQLIQFMSIKPAQIFQLTENNLSVGAPADLAVFNIKDHEMIDAQQFNSKGTNTPFDQWSVFGMPVMTFVSGTCVWKKDNQRKDQQV